MTQSNPKFSHSHITGYASFEKAKKVVSQKFSLQWNGCKIKMGHPKNMFFSGLQNLNTGNYHDTKKLTVSQKNSITWSISLHMIKMSQNPLDFLICSLNVTDISLIDRNAQNSNDGDGVSGDFNNDDSDIDIEDANGKANDDRDINDDGGDDEKFGDDGGTNDADDDHDDDRDADDGGGDEIIMKMMILMMMVVMLMMIFVVKVMLMVRRMVVVMMKVMKILMVVMVRA